MTGHMPGDARKRIADEPADETPDPHIEALRAEEREKLGAAFELLGRTGATSSELRYSEPEHDDSPLVWIVIGNFAGVPAQVAAGLTPFRAAFKLLEQLLDGGQCAHCKRPSGVEEDFSPMPASKQICWYQYDPELKRFRRGCEGSGR